MGIDSGFDFSSLKGLPESPQSYFTKVQQFKTSEHAFLVPSNVGVILRPNRSSLVFSNYGTMDPDRVISWEVDNSSHIKNLETDNIINCGVLASTIAEQKVLLHAFTPKYLKALLKFAALALSVDVEKLVNSATIYYNSEKQEKSDSVSYVDLAGKSSEVVLLDKLSPQVVV